MKTPLSNSFSFSRLLMVMKRDLVENWKNNLQILLSIYGAFLISSLMTYINISNMVESSLYFSYRLGFFIAISIITFIVLFINAGHIMDVMKSKESRISFLMLPATQAEKFTSRALQVMLGTPIIILVALFLAEITRLTLFPLIGAPEALQHFCLFDFKEIFIRINDWDDTGLTWLDKDKTLAIINISCALLAYQSIFILGGTYFYKRPIIKTFSVLILVMTALSFIINYLKSLSPSLFQTFSLQGSIWVDTIKTFTVIIINWALSYFLFTRSQVTERRSMNFLKRKQ